MGGDPRVIPRDASTIRSTGMRMQLDPDGDCIEARWDARGLPRDTMPALTPLSLVQVSCLYEPQNAMIPVFYGEVRVGGNPRNQGTEPYVLRGLKQRLKEVTLPAGFGTGKQPAHRTVIAIMEAAFSSRQLGSYTVTDGGIVYQPAIIFDPSACEDLGFDCRPITNANHQTPHALLELIVEAGKALGVEVAWGVGPDRRFYCRVARSSLLDLTGAGALIQWQAPVAETPCTAVVWYLGRDGRGQDITHLSLAPEAYTLGQRRKVIPVASNLNPWKAVPARYEGATPGTRREGANTDAVLFDGIVRQDNAPDSVVNYFLPRTPGTTTNLSFTLAITPDAPYRRVIVDGNGLGSTVIVEAREWGYNLGALGYGTQTLDFQYGQPLTVTVSSTDTNASEVRLELTELRFEVIDTDLLDSLATYHYELPAQEPAEIVGRYFYFPSQLGGRVRVGDYEQAVETWEYRLSAERGLELAAMTGQADDPFKLAQAALIKRRDAEAVATAVTAR